MWLCNTRPLSDCISGKRLMTVKSCFFFFLQLAYFQERKEIYLSHATKEWPHTPIGKPTFGNEQKCKTEGKLFSY